MYASVIVPFFNAEDVIGDCLKSLSNQSFRDFEIIGIDDGSTDDSLKNARAEYKNINLKVYRQEHIGAGAARNLGVKHAKGKVLVFVDADMTFDERFLENLIEPIAVGKVKGTFSKEEYVSNWGNIWARCWNINEGWQEKRRHPKNYPDHQQVFRAILRTEFDKVKGFTPGGYDDDWSLSKKLGYEATNAPGAIFYHKNPSDLGEIFYHARWVGKRQYKFGFFGQIVALVRATFPVSILIGLYKSFLNFSFQFLIFKIIYDFGIFIGVLERILNGKESK